MKMKKKSYKYICNVCNVYSLLIYLLHMSKSEVESTFFIFNPSIPKVIRENFCHSYTMPDYHKYGRFKRMGIILFGFLVFRYIKLFRLPNFKDSEIFGNDFSRYDSILIGKKKYYCIEDCPDGFKRTYIDHFYSLELKKNRNKLRYYILSILNGLVYCHRFGNNNQCEGVITSSRSVPSYLKNKTIINISLEEAWRNSASDKKEMILTSYGIGKNEHSDLFNRRIILLTQPLWPDFISQDEHLRIYKEILSNYKTCDIVIKTHPRDLFDYKSLDTDLYVLDKPIPVQLLTILGVRYDRAVTVFSTAAYTFKELGAVVDWYGTEISDELFFALGHKSM